MLGVDAADRPSLGVVQPSDATLQVCAVDLSAAATTAVARPLRRVFLGRRRCVGTRLVVPVHGGLVVGVNGSAATSPCAQVVALDLLGAALDGEALGDDDIRTAGAMVEGSAAAEEGASSTMATAAAELPVKCTAAARLAHPEALLGLSVVGRGAEPRGGGLSRGREGDAHVVFWSGCAVYNGSFQSGVGGPNGNEGRDGEAHADTVALALEEASLQATAGALANAIDLAEATLGAVPFETTGVIELGTKLTEWLLQDLELSAASRIRTDDGRGGAAEDRKAVAEEARARLAHFLEEGRGAYDPIAVAAALLQSGRNDLMLDVARANGTMAPTLELWSAHATANGHPTPALHHDEIEWLCETGCGEAVAVAAGGRLVKHLSQAMRARVALSSRHAVRVHRAWFLSELVSSRASRAMVGSLIDKLVNWCGLSKDDAGDRGAAGEDEGEGDEGGRWRTSAALRPSEEDERLPSTPPQPRLPGEDLENGGRGGVRATDMGPEAELLILALLWYQRLSKRQRQWQRQRQVAEVEPLTTEAETAAGFSTDPGGDTAAARRAIVVVLRALHGVYNPVNMVGAAVDLEEWVVAASILELNGQVGLALHMRFRAMLVAMGAGGEGTSGASRGSGGSGGSGGLGGSGELGGSGGSGLVAATAQEQLLSLLESHVFGEPQDHRAHGYEHDPVSEPEKGLLRHQDVVERVVMFDDVLGIWTRMGLACATLEHFLSVRMTAEAEGAPVGGKATARARVTTQLLGCWFLHRQRTSASSTFSTSPASASTSTSTDQRNQVTFEFSPAFNLRLTKQYLALPTVATREYANGAPTSRAHPGSGDVPWQLAVPAPSSSTEGLWADLIALLHKVQSSQPGRTSVELPSSSIR